MKEHIKKVLNIRLDNTTLDRYVSAIFNLSNNNPTYVFRLPDRKKLTFRKSDFTKPVFPNITNVNKFAKSSGKLRMQSSVKHQVKIEDEQLYDELQDFDFDYDDHVKEIIDKNVRSEKDFLQSMNELNDDINDRQQLTSSPPPPPKYIKKKLLKPKTKIEKDEWELLGLDGWSGTIAVSKGDLPRRNEK